MTVGKKKKTIRIDYEKHPEDPNIWFSKEAIRIKKKRVIVVVNWNDHTFEVIDKNTGLSVFSGEKTGTHYVAFLRRIRRTLINLGAKIETKKRKLSKDKRERSDEHNKELSKSKKR